NTYYKSGNSTKGTIPEAPVTGLPESGKGHSPWNHPRSVTRSSDVLPVGSREREPQRLPIDEATLSEAQALVHDLARRTSRSTSINSRGRSHRSGDRSRR